MVIIALWKYIKALILQCNDWTQQYSNDRAHPGPQNVLTPFLFKFAAIHVLFMVVFCQLVMISVVHNTHWIHNKHAPVCTVTVINVCYSCIIENTTSVTPYLRALYDNWLGWTVSESHPSPSIKTQVYNAAHNIGILKSCKSAKLP